MEAALIERIIEAALLAAGQPLNLAQLSALFPEDQPLENGAIERALETLREQAPVRGVELVEVASGYRFQIRAEVQPWVGRLWAERQTRYSRAQLETIALIAYRQPITRGEIEQIRGVAVSSHIIRTLEEREWIRVVGHRDVPGKPALFGTTRTFLDYFNLKSLDQLPPLSELREIPDFDPQLALEPAIDALPTGMFGGADTPVPTDGDFATQGGDQAIPTHAVEATDSSINVEDDEPHAADATLEDPQTGSQPEPQALPERNS